MIPITQAFIEENITNLFHRPLPIVPCKNDWYCVSLPFLYSDSDYVEIYIRKSKDGSFTMADSGDTMAVHCYGAPKKCLGELSRSQNVTFDEETKELSITATDKNFMIRLLELASIILAIDSKAHDL